MDAGVVWLHGLLARAFAGTRTNQGGAATKLHVMCDVLTGSAHRVKLTTDQCGPACAPGRGYPGHLFPEVASRAALQGDEEPWTPPPAPLHPQARLGCLIWAGVLAVLSRPKVAVGFGDPEVVGEDTVSDLDLLDAGVADGAQDLCVRNETHARRRICCPRCAQCIRRVVCST